LMHLMNIVWPNCFETSLHVIGAVMDAIEAMRVCLGPGVLLSYVLQGLFHPARKVREVRISSSSFCVIGSHLLADRSTGVSITRCTWVLRML